MKTLCRALAAAARAAAALAAAAQAAAGPASAADETLADRLAAGAEYRVEAAATYFHLDYPDSVRVVDDTRGELFSRVTMTTQAEIGDAMLLKLGGVVVGSTQQEEHRGAFSMPDHDGLFARHVDLTRAAVVYESDAYDMLLGKVPLAVGVSTLASPANRYGVADGSDPQHPIELGTWQGTVNAYVGDDTLSLSVLPFETRSPTPPSTSRWFGDSGDPSFFTLSLPAGTQALVDAGTSLSSLVSEDYREPHPENWAYLARWKGYGEGFDYFFAGHAGPSIYPVLRTGGGNRLVKENPDALTLSAGFTTTVDAWEWHGEAAYQDTRHGRDQDFVKYVLGLIYRETSFANRIGLEEITPIVEWVDEGYFGDQTADGYVANSSATRPLPKSVIGRVLLRRDSELAFFTGGALNFARHDFALNGGVEYKPDDNLTLILTGSAFQGASDTQFGRWRRNDFVEIRLSRRF